MNPVQRLLQLNRKDIERRKRNRILEEKYRALPAENRLVSWTKDRFRLLAEVKRASLSAGSIRSQIDVKALASSYEQAGASAISVLTEKHYFEGSLDDLRMIRDAVSVPVLQKDFIVDEFQVREAKFYGAAFVLLIAKYLNWQELESLHGLCRELQMNALVEITNERDLEKITLPVAFLGVNSRDLESLQIDKSKFRRLRRLLPDAFLIAESGINSLETLAELIDLDYHGALIGEHFLRAEDPSAELSRWTSYVGALREAPKPVKPKIKICGITSEEDAMLSMEAGAGALGFIFAESPRRIAPEKFREFREKIPRNILCVGVFRGQPEEMVVEIVRDFKLDIAQVYDPMEFTGSAWNAHIARNRSQIEAIRKRFNGNSILWDIKAEENEIADLWKEIAREKVFALAGGLTPENVRLAISICRPEWIDVARGVESAPGVKDKDKLNAFMKEATR